MKFYFRAQDITVTMPGIDIAGKLVLVWKRGSRRSTTEPFPVKEKLSSIDGSLSRTATTTQDLALICTMFKNARNGTFESKSASFSLREETPEGEERKLGTASIDLSSYATPEKSSDRVELSFLEGKMRLQLTLTSHWLKQMNPTDDDDASVSSIGSFASSVRDGADDDDYQATVQIGGVAGGRRIDVIDEDSIGSSVGGAGGSASALPTTERERFDLERDAAIERRWAAEEGRTNLTDELESLRAELCEAREAQARAQAEAKFLREKADRLANENRVLRREQRGGKRDEVVLQLETELVAKEQERADMEEQLSKAFGGVLDDAQERIARLTAERDRLLVSLEELQHKKGGFLTK